MISRTPARAYPKPAGLRFGPTKCRSCQRPIVFLFGRHGKKVPVNLEPTDPERRAPYDLPPYFRWQSGQKIKRAVREGESYERHNFNRPLVPQVSSPAPHQKLSSIYLSANRQVAFEQDDCLARPPHLAASGPLR